jgi:tetratricopeptide (TPR) repeat protein
MEGYVELGQIQVSYDWDWNGAEASYRRALELAPNNATALRAAGSLAAILGKLDQGIEMCQRACVQDPLSATAYMSLAGIFRYAGRLDEALTTYQSVLDLHPQRIVVRLLIATVLVGRGRLDEALSMADQEPEPFARWCGLAYIHQMAGRSSESEVALQELIRGFSKDACYQIAAVYSAREDSDRAFEWLERAYALRDPGLVPVKVEPVFRNLHNDPRWLPFLRKMGLTD